MVVIHIPPPVLSHSLVVIKMSSRRPNPRLCNPGGAGSCLRCGNMYIDFWSSRHEYLIKSYIELQLISVGNTPLSAFRNAELNFGNLACRNWRQTCQLCFIYIYTPFIKAVSSAGMLLRGCRLCFARLQIQLP